MSYKIRNTANDRTKYDLHRTASRFEYEPSLGGTRIRLGEEMEIGDEQYKSSKDLLDEWVGKGMVEVTKISGSADAATKESESPTEDWQPAESLVEGVTVTTTVEVSNIAPSYEPLEEEVVDSTPYQSTPPAPSMTSPPQVFGPPVVGGTPLPASSQVDDRPQKKGPGKKRFY